MLADDAETVAATQWNARMHGSNKVVIPPTNNRSHHIRSGEIGIIDASVIKAKRNRPNQGKNGATTKTRSELEYQSRITRRASRGRAFTQTDKQFNRLHRRVGSTIECVFG